MQIIRWMESEVSDMPGIDFKGKLKDMLPQIDKRARKELFDEYMKSKELKSAQPVCLFP
jgi:hypothetical protein